MKKIYLLNILLVCTMSFLQAQPSKLDSVIIKFQNDNCSFEEFILLGRMECYGNVLYLGIRVNGLTDLYFAASANLYNSLTPFTRLFKEQSIKKSVEEYYLLNKKHFEKLDLEEEKTDKEQSHYYKAIKLCDCLFDKNEDYKKQYIQFVNDKKNYLTPTGGMDSFTLDEIESFQSDYLENYFIKIITE